MDEPRSPVRPLLTYAAAGTPVAVLVFLFFAGFFTSWSGVVVGQRPVADDADPPTRMVIIEAADGAVTERAWPKDLVERLKPPLNNTGVPPLDTPDGAAITTKSRFTLTFAVTPAGGDTELMGSATPGSLGIAILVWFLGLLARNMYVSGSPIELHPGQRRLQQLAAAGQVAPRTSVTRGKKGPPPKGRQKRRRR